MRIRHANRLHDLGEVDVVLIGGGIMSATLASMLGELAPDRPVVVLEQADRIATESSAPWNNAGTGHSGFCELNYMPDPDDASKPAEMARQFLLTRQWWAHLAERGAVEPDGFVHTAPHLSVVFGDEGRDHLRRRHQAMTRSPLFQDLEYSEDPAVIADWAPLVMAGRTDEEPVTATQHRAGTDVDFGALTDSLLAASGARVLTGHRVARLSRRPGGVVVAGRCGRGEFQIRARHVFIGAGGQALRLMQRAGVDEVRGYGVLPVGAAFLRCSDPEVVAQHAGKVYGEAPIGTPPMSVPHLDRRTVDGADHLMFGPYATFSTKLLKHGHLTDFFATLRPTNLWTVASAGATNLDLVRYLISELLASPQRRFRQLQRYYPTARRADWELIGAGQRAQLVKPGDGAAGVLHQGTELVTSADRAVSGLLGASPGASTAVPIMLDLLRRVFPEEWASGWESELTAAINGLAVDRWTDQVVSAATASTAQSLRLAPGAEASSVGVVSTETAG
ncbi:malate:quinone oxidoreductase [Gordonia hydrophobica]|uniref:Probable malate:quinone oxidoreductase n=1 Tax=Gordonia hydrophobica TaxID=40516 RepID=A0ABZ2TZ55_9ACTN|nr:malate:quinone oxidoreductase [Gordonia hydrophobica]MBM7368945.1 malate dehydrogenase (quinone) [Gordonia hydrophobica]